MATGLGARKNNMDLKYMVAPPTSDVVVSGGQSSGRTMIPWPSMNDGGDKVHLWVWGITIASFVIVLGIHWTLGSAGRLIEG
jgi:hypothetical protein